MNKKTKVLIAIGGTGGHVFPGCHLAQHLNEQNYQVQLITDKRGFKYLNKFDKFKITILNSSPLKKNGLIKIFYSLIVIVISIFRSLLFLIFSRPSIIVGMGGYSSFPICVAASILKVKFIIYENNLIIGKANKYLLPFTEKILVSYKDVEGIPSKYRYKISEIGNILKKEIINFPKKENYNDKIKKISILVLGGSQAAKVFAEVLPEIFKKLSNLGISVKIYQQCLLDQNETLRQYYQRNKIDFETFNFSSNLIKYFPKVNLAITRSGSSMLAELTNANIPFISVPLPSSADNHQLKNAIYYQRKNFSFLVEEKDLKNKLLNLLKEINDNNSILNKIKHNQSQHSDKNVYNNNNHILKEINEKN